MEHGPGTSSAPRGTATRAALSTLFVTGASGFIGRRLLAAIPAGRYERVVALSRGDQAPIGGVTWVKGGLREAERYAPHLSPDTIVMHLAAATGSASREAHRVVNIEGTEALVRAAREADVRGLLFVSSIAARFRPDRHYPYAAAKRAAEKAVQIGGVPHLIVRPAIVLGPGAAILEKLRGLAGGPVIVAIGGGGAKVQPIHVDDLARALAALAARGVFDGQTIELGGPEVLTMADLLRRARAAMGRGPAPLVPLPYWPMRGALIAATALLGRRSPVTPGQITSFVQDGTTQPSPYWDEIRSTLRGVDEMLRTS